MYASVTLVQEYFSRSAARTPDKVAVACRGDRATFAEIEAQTNAFARQMKAAGVERGRFVPYFMAKGVGSIRSMLSILKADCAYVPVDVKTPKERLEGILKSANATHVLVDDASAPLVPALLGEDHGLILLNVDQITEADTSPLEYANISRDVAYVLFTSGSTGTPKGVMISHQSIRDYIDWCVRTYALEGDDVIANHAPLHFDNSTFDLYCAFSTGATLQLMHDELNKVFQSLVTWLEEREVTTIFVVPSILTILLKTGLVTKDSFPKMRRIICAGEVLPPDVLREWMHMFPRVQFTNMYGPTEITVDCTYYIVPEPPAEDAEYVPIGKARTNMELFLRDDDGVHPVAPGREGELLVRGISVSYGYLNNPERTEAAFIQNPMNPYFPDTLYCTGDRVRVAEDGNLLFLGRKDHQIKYMGNRIELGEIEAALMKVEGVKEAVVVFNDSPVAEQRAIGAMVAVKEGVRRPHLINGLKTFVPPYMLPKKWVIVDQIPRGGSSKLDRKAVEAQVFSK